MTIGRGAVLLLVCIAPLTGCSTFRGSTRLDMGPFAENTSKMLAEAEQLIQPLPFEYLREYQLGARRDAELTRDIETVRRSFSGIGMYSLQMVSLNASRLSESERANKLADYMQDVLGPLDDPEVQRKAGMTRAYADSIVANIRASTTFMAAIGAADPLTYRVVQLGIDAVDRVSAIITPRFDEIYEDILVKFAESLGQLRQLDEQEAQDVRTYLALQQYRLGAGSKETVLALDPSLGEVLGKAPKTAALDMAQDMLRQRLDATDAIRAHLDARRVLYRKQVDEVFDLTQELDRRVRAGRMMLIYWQRAHSNLAQGVQVPPAIDLGGLVSSSAKKAVGAVVP